MSEDWITGLIIGMHLAIYRECLNVLNGHWIPIPTLGYFSLISSLVFKWWDSTPTILSFFFSLGPHSVLNFLLSSSPSNSRFDDLMIWWFDDLMIWWFDDLMISCYHPIFPFHFIYRHHNVIFVWFIIFFKTRLYFSPFFSFLFIVHCFTHYCIFAFNIIFPFLMESMVCSYFSQFGYVNLNWMSFFSTFLSSLDLI